MEDRLEVFLELPSLPEVGIDLHGLFQPFEGLLDILYLIEYAAILKYRFSSCGDISRAFM